MPPKASTHSWRSGSRSGKGNKLLGIRKSPFEPDEDVTSKMIEEVAGEAEQIGQPLVQTERELLASEVWGLRVRDEVHVRLQRLVNGIVKRQYETGEWKRNPACLLSAIEWCGDPDQEYPYVVRLVEDAISEQRSLQAKPRPRWDFAGLILIGIAVVLGLMTIPLLLELLWRNL